MTPKTRLELLNAVKNLESEFVRRGIQEMRADLPDLEHLRWIVAVDNRSFLE